jgi:hypothetical protein
MIFDQPFVLNVHAGSYMWERVEHAYNSKEERLKRHMGSMPVRDVDSIRSKWKSLKNSKKPTGDPDCPKEVRRAKRIAWDIETGTGVFNLDDDDSCSEDDEEDDDSDSSSAHSEVLSRPELNHNHNIVPETLLVRTDVVPETLAPVIISASSESEQEEAAAVPDAQILSPVHDQEEDYQGGKAAKGAQRSKKYSVPNRLGMSDEELQAVAERLRDEDKEKKKFEKKKGQGHKSQGPAKVPENPGHSKRRVLQNELKEADESFANSMREHEREVIAAQKAAERQHQEKMKRLELQSEQAERRHQEELAARRQENLLSERRLQADADRSQILFSAIMMGIASVTGISPQLANSMQVLARPGTGEAQPPPFPPHNPNNP